MKGIEIFCGIVMLVSSLAIILLVVVQSSPKGSSGISALTGGDSFYGQNKSRTKDAILVRLTKVAATLFFIITIGVHTILSYGWFS